LPDIAYSYVPSDGDQLSPSGLNEDIYDTTAGASLLETTNGRIELANLASSFKVRTRMIQPWKVAQGHGAGSPRPSDHHQDVLGGGTQWLGVAAANITFKQNWDASMAWMYCSAFGVPWRQRGGVLDDEDEDGNTRTTPPKILVRMHLDGAEVPHTNRGFPEDVFYSSTRSFGTGYDYSFSRIQVSARWFQMFHQVPALSKGWHTLGMQLYVGRNIGQERLDLDAPKVVIPDANYDAYNAVRLYVRNARVITFL